MSKLRKVDGVRYDLEIPELGKTIHYRAFKVGEHKTLLQAMEFKDDKAIINTLVDLIQACTFGELDLTKTPMHILDLIFLRIYTKSIGHIAKALYECGGRLEDGSACDHKMNVEVNLDLANLVYPDLYVSNKVIDLGGGMLLKLRVPSFETLKKLQLDANWMDLTEQFIYAGIECIVDGDDVKIPGVDFSEEELTTWINELDGSVMDHINQFFMNIPTLEQTVHVNCPKCGKAEQFQLKGLEDFFV